MSKTRKILIIILSAVFVFCLVNVGYGIYNRVSARNEYDDAKNKGNVPEITLPDTTIAPPVTTAPSTDVSSPDTTISPETTAAPEIVIEPDDASKTLLLETDMLSLIKQNSDVVGWIMIPGSNISYPMVIGEDNEFYLYHTWAKRWNWAGAIYLDYRMSRSFSDFNTIIYGHNMEGGDMFADLLKYRDQAYYNSHPYVYVVLPNSVRRYDIFSAYEADVENGHTYSTGITSEETKRGYLDYCIGESDVECVTKPETKNGIITLSTCTHTGIYDYKTRWVVQATMAFELTRGDLGLEDIVIPATTKKPETTKAPETTPAPETTAAPETTVAPETTPAPEETTAAPEETTAAPETTRAPIIIEL